MTTYSHGDPVNVVDEKLDGTLYYEGKAEVLRPVNAETNTYMVRFDDGRRVRRQIYPEAQTRLLSFIRRRNNDRETAMIFTCQVPGCGKLESVDRCTDEDYLCYICHDCWDAGWRYKPFYLHKVKQQQETEDNA